MQVQLLTNQSHWDLSPQEDTVFVVLPETENQIRLTFQKPDINCRLICLSALTAQQKVTLQTESIHLVPRTHCHTQVYASLDSHSSFSYIGKIIIDSTASATESYLEQKDLILGEKAQSHSQPILEIHNHDVQASHASSTGRIQLSELFYLMSRGVSEKDAKNILQQAFFAAALKEITDEKILIKIEKYLQKKEKNV